MRCYTKEDIDQIKATFKIDKTYRDLYENTLKHKEILFNSQFKQHKEMVTQEEIDELKEILT